MNVTAKPKPKAKAQGNARTCINCGPMDADASTPPSVAAPSSSGRAGVVLQKSIQMLSRDHDGYSEESLERINRLKNEGIFHLGCTGGWPLER